MSSEKTEVVHKVVLSSKKVVLLREMKIKYQELAMKAVGNQAKDNQMLAATMVQKELLKILIHSIDGKTPSPTEIEKLDDLFSYAEYMQLNQVLNKITGGDDLGEFQIEIELIGKK